MRQVLAAAVVGSIVAGAARGAEPPAVFWEATYGTVGYDRGTWVEEVRSGGFILAGSKSTGFHDAWLIRTDPEGRVLWEKTFGGARRDEANCVQETEDGSFIVVGTTASFSPDDAMEYEDVYLFKVDASGNLLWERSFGGDDYDLGFCVRQVPGGGFVVAGDSGGPGFLAKTDEAGGVIWLKTFPAIFVPSVDVAPDGGFILAGMATVPGNTNDLWLARTDPEGDVIWEKTFGGIGYEEQGFARATRDGGCILTGSVWFEGLSSQAALIRTGPEGDVLWQRFFGISHHDYGFSVEETADGSFLLAGLADSGSGLASGYLVKANASGDLLWETRVPHGPAVTFESGGETADGGVAALGYSQTHAGQVDFFLVKLGPPWAAPRAAISVPVLLSAATVAPVEVTIRMRDEDDEIRAFSFGLAHDPSVATVEKVEPGQRLIEFGAVEFFDVDLAPEPCGDGRTGIAVGTIMSLEPPLRALPGGTAHVVAQVTYRARAAGATPIEPVDCLGAPPVDLIVSTPGGAIDLEARAGALRFDGTRFIRGDADADGRITIADAVEVLFYLFGDEPLACVSAADANESGDAEIGDAIFLLFYLFAQGAAPPPPFPACGLDPDSLDCASFPSCP
jgi:outer membrane protein assembly factor BamB